MLHNFFHWLQWGLGKGKAEDAISWSQAIHESLNFWNLFEGMHLITVGLFFGTILMVDLRLLGVAFKQTPVSKLSDKTLTLTVVGFGILVFTGILLFMAKPEEYYHNLSFRWKMIFIVLAAINIAIFHTRVQKNQPEWDLGPTPAGAKISAIISLVCWLAVMSFGRLIAYNTYDCGKPLSDAVNAFAECAYSEHGAMKLDGVTVIKKGGAH